MKNKMDGQQEKQPILLSFGLIMDFLIIGFSVALILLMALNMPKRDETESSEKMKFTGGTNKQIAEFYEELVLFRRQIADAMALSLSSTFLAWITSMFGGIYSMTILFGKKYNWPCCPQLKDQIQRELFGFLIEDEKKKNIKIEV